MLWVDALANPIPRREATSALVNSVAELRNPSSLHGPGRAARRALDELSERLFAQLNCSRAEADIIFTGGAAEGVSIALQGRTLAMPEQRTTMALRCARSANPQSTGGSGGCVRVWVDDQTGSVIDPGEFGAADGVQIFDATLALGRSDTFLPAGETVVVLSGLTCGVPPGIGAIIARKEVVLSPSWGGGGQEHGVRSGSQAVHLAVAWNAALCAPTRRPWLREAATRVSDSISSAGYEVLLGPSERADGIVVAIGDGIRGLRDRLGGLGVHPTLVRVGPNDHGLRFAVDGSSEDDDIDNLVAAIHTVA